MANYIRITFPALFLLFLIFLPSCANYQLNIRDQNWAQALPEPGLSVAHTVYLIGNVGWTSGDTLAPAVRLLGTKLDKADANSAVVFMGDNVYPEGMAELGSKDNRFAEDKLRRVLDELRDFKGKPFFIPGSHDWATFGIDGLKRQRDFIREYLGREDVWFPDPGCGDPEEIEIGKYLVLLLIDSQWWLANWEKHPFLNEGCSVKSRNAFRLAFDEAIKGNRDKNIVVAMHHPLFSNGPHGGQFTWQQHLFPLRELNRNLWLPLPVIGSLYPFVRSAAGLKQDVAHPDYREMGQFMIEIARKNGRFIFAGGHEANLQYLENDDQYFIVSGGGGTLSSPSKANNGATFAYGNTGFAQLDFYEDGSAWVQFWVPEGDGSRGRMVYRRKIKGPLSAVADPRERDFTFYRSGVDSLEVPVSTYDYSRSGFGEWFWGKHYRDAYEAKVKFPVLDLSSYMGGVKPVDRGGGYQTNSLYLQAADGRQYAMRSISKDPTRLLPYPLNRSDILMRVIRDSYTGSHPFSATPLAAMQDAVNLYHTNPVIYYVPSQPALGNFNNDFGNALYLVEERPDDKVWGRAENFGKPKELLSTEKVVRESLESHDKVIDQDWALRARLFDMTINDWDRHDDQWRWAEIDTSKKTVFRPVPRDRDQAMSKYDGFIFLLARATTPASRPLRNFKPLHQRIWWSNYGGRYFDSSFLNEQTWEDWEREVRFIQKNLTDQVIEKAFREAWPPNIYRLDGPEVVSILKGRRDNLLTMARELYEFRSRFVDVVGTQKRDLFEVERKEDGETVVRVYDTNKEGERQDLIYERVFDPKLTREIRLYGLGNEDIFQVQGKGRRGIRIRIVGGPDEDTFVDQSNVAGLARKTIIHDIRSEESTMEVGPETNLRITDNPELNIYNRRARHYEHNALTGLPNIGFNPDDGILIGAAGSYVHYSYSKTPYAGRHNFWGRFALATSGAEFGYQSEIIDAIGQWEFTLGFMLRSPLYARNFYGFGNETVNQEEQLGVDFNRVRMGDVRVAPAMMRIINNASRFSIGPTYEFVEVQRTNGRFIDEYAKGENSPIAPGFFSGQSFLGVHALYTYSNLDDLNFPTNGLNFSAEAGWKTRIDGSGRNFPYVEGSISGYQPLDVKRRIVLGTRIGGRQLFSNEFEFYQGATLGGSAENANFRGFRRDRFVGRSAFYQNIDLRWALSNAYNRILPFTFGILGGFDHGRVWYEKEESKTWHYSYGGGLFIAPLDVMSAQLTFFRGDTKEWRFAFTGSFLF